MENRLDIFILYSSLLFREVNKTLRDENDSLRATIDSHKSTAFPADVSRFLDHRIFD